MELQYFMSILVWMEYKLKWRIMSISEILSNEATIMLFKEAKWLGKKSEILN